MTVYRLGPEALFPDPADAEPDGLLCVGGDLHPQRLLVAYACGIFPWYEEGLPILWWSPDPRLVLDPSSMRMSKSLKRTLRRGTYRVTADTAFEDVMRACANVPRRGQAGTWITEEMVEGYTRLHEQGFAHSIETWNDDGELVGGLYGVSLGSAFFGESMFAAQPDASKVALARLAQRLVQWDFDMIDCQVTTKHLVSLGAYEITRKTYLERLESCLHHPTRRGRWEL